MKAITDKGVPNTSRAKVAPTMADGSVDSMVMG